MNIEINHAIEDDIANRIVTQDKFPKNQVFEISQNDLKSRFGWGKINIPSPYQVEPKKDSDFINCRFPLECSVVFDTANQKTLLVVSLIKDDPQNNHYYTLDIDWIANDLVSMGYLKKEKIPEFTYQMVTAHPNPEVTNWLDSTDETINGFTGVFELQTCQNPDGEVCAVISESNTKEVIGEIPVYPINEFEHAIRQRNIEIYNEATVEGDEIITNSAVGSLIALVILVGLVTNVKYRIESRIERNRENQISED